MALNLRGVRESGTFFAVPTYGFMVAILGMAATACSGYLAGNLPRRRERRPRHGRPRRAATRDTLTTIALVFLLARAFSSGCAALTGVEAISNGVPGVPQAEEPNAATTLLLLGMIAITMMMSIIVLARQMGLKYVDPHDLDRLSYGRRLAAARRATTSTR